MAPVVLVGERVRLHRLQCVVEAEIVVLQLQQEVVEDGQRVRCAIDGLAQVQAGQRGDAPGVVVGGPRAPVQRRFQRLARVQRQFRRRVTALRSLFAHGG